VAGRDSKTKKGGEVLKKGGGTPFNPGGWGGHKKGNSQQQKTKPAFGEVNQSTKNSNRNKTSERAEGGRNGDKFALRAIKGKKHGTMFLPKKRHNNQMY